MQYPQGMAILKSYIACARTNLTCSPAHQPPNTLLSNYAKKNLELFVKSAKNTRLPLHSNSPFMLTIRKKLAEQQASKATGGSSGIGSPSGSGLKRKLSFRSQLLTAGMLILLKSLTCGWWICGHSLYMCHGICATEASELGDVTPSKWWHWIASTWLLLVNN